MRPTQLNKFCFRQIILDTFLKAAYYIVHLLNLFVFSPQDLPICGTGPEISADYIIQYPEAGCSTATPPDPVTVTANAYSSVLTIMERATDIGPDYRFTAAYFGSTLGYSIRTLNGTSSIDPCYWFIYIRLPTGEEFQSPLGASNYIIPASGYSIIWRFETFNPDNTNTNTTGVSLYIVYKTI